MRNRGIFMVATLVLALGLAACGRATDEQIQQALGITPTPTRSPEEIASATAAAAATESARATSQADPGAGELARGDASRGQRQFLTWCQACHGPTGRGGNLLEPGGPGAGVDPDTLLPLLREGTGHGEGPTFGNTQITDSQVDDLAAFIRSRAGE